MTTESISGYILFDEKTASAFKEAWQKAKKTRQEVFVFDNREIDVRYAGYVIEYLESKPTLKERK